MRRWHELDAYDRIIRLTVAYIIVGNLALLAIALWGS